MRSQVLRHHFISCMEKRKGIACKVFGMRLVEDQIYLFIQSNLVPSKKKCNSIKLVLLNYFFAFTVTDGIKGDSVTPLFSFLLGMGALFSTPKFMVGC